MKAKSVIFCSLLATTVSAYAESGLYVFGSIGQSKFDYSGDTPRMVEDYLGEDIPVNLSQDKSDTAYKLQVGYQVNDNFAVEVGYVDLGKYSYKGGNSFSDGDDEAEIDFKGRVKVSGFTLSGLAMLPLNAQWSLFAKLGVFNNKVKEKASGRVHVVFEEDELTDSASGSHSSTKVNPVYGVGAIYNINEKIAARVEIERFNQLGDSGMNKANVDLFSLGAAYRF